MKRNRILVVGLLAAGAIAAALLWPRDGATRERRAATDGPATAQAEPVAPASSFAPEAPPPRPSLPPSGGTAFNAAAGLEQARAGYAEYAVYPPWSRPATPAYKELYEFNQAGSEHQQAIGAIGATEVHARLAIDHFFVGPGRTATITAECWTMTDGERGEIDYTATAEVHLSHDEETDDPNDTTAFMYGYHAVDDQIVLTRGGANPALRTGTLDVSRFPAMGGEPREARLVVYFDPEGAELRPLALNFAYSAQAPMRILGMTKDKIVDGSLVLTLTVDVTNPVPIRVRGALAQAGDREHPIAIYDDWFRPKEAGIQEVPVRFFGKILHDADLDGPYELFSLHGVAYYADAPTPNVFWQDDQTFTTRAHRAEDFAPDEWKSPAKDAKLGDYDQVIEELRQQHE